MPETPQLVNTHWYKGVEFLPPNTQYIGRPSIYGNKHSTKSGQHTIEECVALHRVDVLTRLTQNPSFFQTLIQDLDGKDLACWCKQRDKVRGCHGENYLLILSPEYRARTYTKSVLFYLLEDVRRILKKFRGREPVDGTWVEFLNQYMLVEELAMEVNYAIEKIKRTDPSIESVHFLFAYCAVQLELAFQETQVELLEYRFACISWRLHRFCNPDILVGNPPECPRIKLDKVPKHDKARIEDRAKTPRAR